MQSKPEELKLRTKRFALRIVRLYRSLPKRSLPKSTDAQVIGKQALRSGTSVAANYCAVCRARSKPEFAAKMGIVVEEADETVFWLELLVEAAIVSKDKLNDLLLEANELLAIFAASLRTAKNLKATINDPMIR
ncbi:MAG TPA: four helix bundle protein [Terriglobales bacterium]|nr:four helix bundle protein [Terriglobales bacterium]